MDLLKCTEQNVNNQSLSQIFQLTHTHTYSHTHTHTQTWDFQHPDKIQIILFFINFDKKKSRNSPKSTKWLLCCKQFHNNKIHWHRLGWNQSIVLCGHKLLQTHWYSNARCLCLFDPFPLVASKTLFPWCSIWSTVSHNKSFHCYKSIAFNILKQVGQHKHNLEKYVKDYLVCQAVDLIQLNQHE